MIDDLEEARMRRLFEQALANGTPRPEAVLRFQALLASLPPRRQARRATTGWRAAAWVAALATLAAVVVGILAVHLAINRAPVPAGPTPRVTAPTTTTPRASGDPAAAAYRDLAARDLGLVGAAEANFKAQCRLPDMPRADLCRAIGVAVQGAARTFGADLDGVIVPERLRAADAQVRLALADVGAAAAAIIADADAHRAGPFSSDLVSADAELMSALDAVEAAAQGG